jgi:hypothetical protein
MVMHIFFVLKVMERDSKLINLLVKFEVEGIIILNIVFYFVVYTV